MPLKRFVSRLFHWELWPFLVIYAPLGFVWLYYAMKAKAFYFFSNVNPGLTFSGFEGERKIEMYNQLPHGLYPPTIYVFSHEEPVYILARVKEAGISFPFVVKPDVGTQGLMFRIISHANELLSYHACLKADYVIQSLVELPQEYSVFYIRYPGEKNGKITGLILKEYLFVKGDGHSTLLQLMQQHEKAKYRLTELSEKHAQRLTEVIPGGEVFHLSITGNHNRGARFINLHHEIDERLLRVFDGIADAVPHFHYGRYDLKCSSLEDLKNGVNIQVLEYNGTGAEPNHIYDCGMRYFTALGVIKQHWKDMYRIGRIHYKNGIPYWSFRRGRKYLKKAYGWYAELRKMDQSFHP